MTCVHVHTRTLFRSTTTTHSKICMTSSSSPNFSSKSSPSCRPQISQYAPPFQDIGKKHFVSTSLLAAFLSRTGHLRIISLRRDHKRSRNYRDLLHPSPRTSSFERRSCKTQEYSQISQTTTTSGMKALMVIFSLR